MAQTKPLRIEFPREEVRREARNVLAEMGVTAQQAMDAMDEFGRQWRHAHNVAGLRMQARAERAEALLWLRQHVDGIYDDLGLPRPPQPPLRFVLGRFPSGGPMRIGPSQIWTTS